jgi:Rrf2 family protein
MQRLCKAGYIESIKGFNGGFKLLVDPEKVPFLEIYELFDGKLSDTCCLISRQNCQNSCIFGSLVSSVNKQVIEKFSKTKISDFIEGHIIKE